MKTGLAKFMLCTTLIGVVISQGAFGQAIISATSAPDCNDPDAHDFACTHPTTDIINAAIAQGYEYYIGHAEPTALFFSTQGASGNNMRYQFKLPIESLSAPNQTGTVVTNFELFITFWAGLALCDPNSNPFGSCVANSDGNNPATAGAAVLETQFYPPGINCSNTQWCAALHINTLQNNTITQVNNCFEPTTSAFITTTGASGGPALLMNPGDTIQLTIHDTGNGLETDVLDLTTSGTGSMVASIANGFVHNANQTDCTTTGFNFHPMYATASPGQGVPWASLGLNVGFDFEIGHWELCGDAACATKPDGPDADDVSCFTVRGIGGCLGADTDHDGTSYKADWPDGATNHPGTLVLSAPGGVGVGPLSAPPSASSTYNQGYNTITFRTTESTSGAFYPFFSQNGTGAACVFNFGNDQPGTTNEFGKAAQYGTTITNPCLPSSQLTIAKHHTDPFTQGDIGDTFTITVTNSGLVSTSGTVTVTDSLPSSLTATAMSGLGWTCILGTLTCTRPDALAGGSSYPLITLTVNVATNSSPHITNTASVSGGGSPSSSVMDFVTVLQHTTTTVTPVSGDFDDFVTLAATVTPPGVTGSVVFLVNGGAVGAGAYNSTTGVATLSYLIPLPAGMYSLEADFTSTDPLYLNSKGVLSTGLTVTLAQDILSYSGDTVIANGGTATISGTLLEDGVKPIAGRTVVFTLGSNGTKQTCNGVTNAAGFASCTISPVSQPLGPVPILASFAGDAFYLPSSATSSAIVNPGTPGSPFADDFNEQTLNTSLWTFVNPVGDGSYALNGSELVLNVPGGSNHDPVFGGADNAVRITQNIAGNNFFQVEVKFDSIPTTMYQMQGVVVEQDAANYLRFEVFSDGSQQYIYATEVLSANQTTLLTVPIAITGPSVWLRVRKAGSTWTESWSADGLTFTDAITYTQALSPARIGPYAGNYNTTGLAPAFTALVDYFH